MQSEQSEQIEYLREYKKKMEKFCKLSTAEHEHNIFTEEHMSTLTNIGFYTLGHNVRRITYSFDEDSTLIEVGAGTGAGAEYMLAGLFGEEYPDSCIHFNINDSVKKAKINRYIYTDPFNNLVDVPPQYKKKIPIQWAKTDIFNVIQKIQNDDTIKNAILLVVCPPPIHNDRECRYNVDKPIGDTIVSTDVIALVESVMCPKIRHVMIIRYNNCARSDLDGTNNFHSYHIPQLRKFKKWYIHDEALVPVDTYNNGYDYYSRYLHWFSRYK